MLSPNDAAQRVGRSKSTILRDIRKGKLSAARDDQGNYQIDRSELARVYGGDAADADHDPRHDAPRPAPDDAADAAMTRPDLAVFQVSLEAAQALAEEREKTIADLRDRLDQSERERIEAQSKLTAVLTDQRPPAPAGSAAPSEQSSRDLWMLVILLFAGIVWWFIQW